MTENPSPPLLEGRARRRGRSRPQAIDLAVARGIRQRRLELGLTQQQLAELIGVPYQQLHKYEAGINRLSAGRLHRGNPTCAAS